MLPTALVPIRIGPTAKRRLAHVLSPGDRMRLIRELFSHVASVMTQAGLPTIALASGRLDAPEGVVVWRDEVRGLNRAVAAAMQRIGAPLLVVHADLPLLTTDDIDRVLASSGDVVVARAHDGGTNGLLLRQLIAPAFGRASALAHAARARQAGLRATVIDSPGFALDVDDEPTLSASGVASVGASGRRTRP